MPRVTDPPPPDIAAELAELQRALDDLLPAAKLEVQHVRHRDVAVHQVAGEENRLGPAARLPRELAAGKVPTPGPQQPRRPGQPAGKRPPTPVTRRPVGDSYVSPDSPEYHRLLHARGPEPNPPHPHQHNQFH